MIEFSFLHIVCTVCIKVFRTPNVTGITRVVLLRTVQQFPYYIKIRIFFKYILYIFWDAHLNRLLICPISCCQTNQIRCIRWDTVYGIFIHL